MHLRLMRTICKMLYMQLSGSQLSFDDQMGKSKAKKGQMAQTIKKLNREVVNCYKNVEQVDRIVRLLAEMCSRFSN